MYNMGNASRARYNNMLYRQHQQIQSQLNTVKVNMYDMCRQTRGIDSELCSRIQRSINSDYDNSTYKNSNIDSLPHIANRTTVVIPPTKYYDGLDDRVNNYDTADVVRNNNNNNNNTIKRYNSSTAVVVEPFDL